MIVFTTGSLVSSDCNEKTTLSNFDIFAIKIKTGKYIISNDFLGAGSLVIRIFSSKYKDIMVDISVAQIVIDGKDEYFLLVKAMKEIDELVEEREEQEKWTSDW